MNHVMTPKVSVCVPIYGVEAYIKDCLQSLFNQTYKNIEYIFVNDATKDRSIEILEATINEYPHFANQIKIINNSKNEGLAKSRLNAIEHSTGDFIFHVDSDDLISLNCIEMLVAKAVDDDLDIVFGDYAFYYSVGKISCKSAYFTANKNDYLKKLISREENVEPVIWNRLIKREIHLKALPIPDLNFAEDWATFPRVVFYAKKIGKINDVTYFYRKNNSASYCANIKLQYIENLIKAGDVLTRFFEDKDSDLFSEPIKQMHRWIAIFIYGTGNSSYIKKINEKYPKMVFDIKDLSSYDNLLLVCIRTKSFFVIRFLNYFRKQFKRIYFFFNG